MRVQTPTFSQHRREVGHPLIPSNMCARPGEGIHETPLYLDRDSAGGLLLRHGRHADVACDEAGRRPACTTPALRIGYRDLSHLLQFHVLCCCRCDGNRLFQPDVFPFLGGCQPGCARGRVADVHRECRGCENFPARKSGPPSLDGSAAGRRWRGTADWVTYATSLSCWLSPCCRCSFLSCLGGAGFVSCLFAESASRPFAGLDSGAGAPVSSWRATALPSGALAFFSSALEATFASFSGGFMAELIRERVRSRKALHRTLLALDACSR